MKLINQKKTFNIGQENLISDCLIFIEESLKSLNVNKKLMLRTKILSEELLIHFIENAEEGSSIGIQVKKYLGDTTISIRSKGEKVDLIGASEIDHDSVLEMEEYEAEQVFRAILLKSNKENFRYSYKRGNNLVKIAVGQAEQSMLVMTVVALLLGLLMGILMKFVFPAGLSEGISTYALTPFKTMFMNALKIVIAPVVFFSIVSCVSGFKDLSELGRIGLKVMGMYILTTLMAVLLGVGMSKLIHPGTFGFALTSDIQSDAVSVNTNVDTSLLHTIVNIVPSNFIKPFAESDTLQIIFLAMLCGVAVGMCGQYSAKLQELFEALNSLFLSITTIISKFIPLAVFCSVALMLTQIGGRSLLPLLGLIATHAGTILCMLIVYGFLIILLGKLNPFTFFKKNREGMVTSFTLASSSAAMPTNMKTCTDKLGISSKVSSFSIPLGATINMDGTSIFLTVCGIFLANAYGITVPSSAIVSLLVTIILLSLGCPGVPGAGIVCLGVILGSLGVPIEAVGLVIGIYPFIDMMNTMSNCTGDVAVTLVVAKSEGLVNLEKFNNM